MIKILRHFLVWLDEFLVKEGASAAIKGILGLMAFAALLGTLFGNTTVKTSMAVVTLLVLLLTVAVMATSDRQLRRQAKLDKEFLSRYVNALTRAQSTSHKITAWNQVVSVDADGSILEHITIEARAQSDEIQYFRIQLGSNWNVGTNRRRLVQLRVRYVGADSKTSGRPDTTRFWRKDGMCEVIVHFRDSVHLGDKFKLLFEVQLPQGSARKIDRNNPGLLTVRFPSEVEHANYRVILPDNYDALEDSRGFHATDESVSISRKKEMGRIELGFSVTNAPADRPIGMVLE